MRSMLPTGTITFVFTDVEGSTQLLAELGDERYAAALADHRRVVREAFAAQGGVEVDTQGDAFFFAFPTASGAADAAAAAVSRLDGPVRVRVGMHTGEALVTGEGYVGVDVHRAARIGAAAHGGQVVISSSTASLVEPVQARDLGEHRLKDLTAPQRLFQLVAPGLQDTFPPLRTLSGAGTGLPVQVTPLVGRDRELAAARELLDAGARLLTLTGPGGSGKTRLALQLAADLADEFADGIVFVDVSPVRDATLVLPTLAQAIGLRDTPGATTAEAIGSYLADRRVLLVVDNVEQVVDSAADLAHVLAACRDVKLLATSRTALHVSGEQEFPVPPLAEGEAVELFAERARSVRPGWEFDGDRPVVAEICARLDGLPLAIELAAARVKLLPPAQLLERLGERLALLSTGARDAPERQRTLRAAIDWSYELLDEDERALFARLSVFAGPFTLDAAEAVCEASLDVLASLVDKSLLTDQHTAEAASFALLQTVREYARERLAELPDGPDVARRRAEYVLAVVAGPRPDRAANPELSARIRRELDDVRGAHAWFVENGDVERELRLATQTFWGLWNVAGIAETYGWVETGLTRADGVDQGVVADAHGAGALAAALLGDPDASRRHAEATVTLARELGDERRLEWGLRALSFTEPDAEERRRLLRECERLLVAAGNQVGLAWVRQELGNIFFDEGDFERARSLFGEAADMFEREGKTWEAAIARLSTGRVLMCEGRGDAARGVLRDALTTHARLGSSTSIAETVVMLAAVRVETDAAGAARMLAASRAVFERERAVPDKDLTALIDETESSVRDHLGDRFDDECAAGRALDEGELVELALHEPA